MSYTLDSLSKRIETDTTIKRDKILDAFLIAWLEGDLNVFDHPDNKTVGESEIDYIHKDVNYLIDSYDENKTWTHPYRLCRRYTLDRMVSFKFYPDYNAWRERLNSSIASNEVDDKETPEFDRLCRKTAFLIRNNKLNQSGSFSYRDFISRFIITNRVAVRFASSFNVSIAAYTQLYNLDTFLNAEIASPDQYSPEFQYKNKPLEGLKFRRNKHTKQLCINYFQKLIENRKIIIDNRPMSNIAELIKNDLQLQISSDTVRKYITSTYHSFFGRKNRKGKQK